MALERRATISRKESPFTVFHQIAATAPLGRKITDSISSDNPHLCQYCRNIHRFQRVRFQQDSSEEIDQKGGGRGSNSGDMSIGGIHLNLSEDEDREYGGPQQAKHKSRK